MRPVVSTDYPHQPAPHGKCEGSFQQPRQVLVERSLIDHRAPVLAAQIRRPRRERNDLMPRRKPDSVCQDIGALIIEHNLLNCFSRPIKPPRPPRGGFNKLERHVLVVPDIPSIDPGASGGSGPKRPIGSLSPGNPNPPRLLTNFDLRLISQPSPLIRK